MKDYHVKHILVPVDFSEIASHAIRHAERIAELSGARITLLHVIEPYDVSMGTDVGVTAVAARFLRELENRQQKELDKIAGALTKRSHLSVRTVITIGQIASTIRKTARELRANLVVMGTHGATGFVENMLGSKTYRTATLSPVPLLSVHKPIRQKGYSDIIYPVRLNARSEQKLPYALFLAKLFSARIHAIGLLPRDAARQAGELRAKCEKIRSACKKRGVEARVSTTKNPQMADAVLAYARAFRAPLVVIRQDDDFQLVELFRGTFPKRILHKALAPVLVIPKV